MYFVLYFVVTCSKSDGNVLIHFDIAHVLCGYQVECVDGIVAE